MHQINLVNSSHEPVEIRLVGTKVEDRIILPPYHGWDDLEKIAHRTIKVGNDTVTIELTQS